MIQQEDNSFIQSVFDEILYENLEKRKNELKYLFTHFIEKERVKSKEEIMQMLICFDFPEGKIISYNKDLSSHYDNLIALLTKAGYYFAENKQPEIITARIVQHKDTDVILVHIYKNGVRTQTLKTTFN